MEGVQGAPRGGEGGRHGIESRSGSQSRAAGGEVRGGIERAAALDQEETCDEFSSNFFGRASIRYGVASEMLMWFARRKNRKQVGVGAVVLAMQHKARRHDTKHEKKPDTNPARPDETQARAGPARCSGRAWADPQARGPARPGTRNGGRPNSGPRQPAHHQPTP